MKLPDIRRIRVGFGQGGRAETAVGNPAEQDAAALRAEVDRLRRAPAARAVVDQACGMVMVLVPCHPGPARNLPADVYRRDVRLTAGQVTTPEGCGVVDEGTGHVGQAPDSRSRYGYWMRAGCARSPGSSAVRSARGSTRARSTVGPGDL